MLWKCAGNCPYRTVIWMYCDYLRMRCIGNICFDHCPQSRRNAKSQFLLNSKNADPTSEAVLGLIFWGEFWTLWSRSRNISLRSCFKLWGMDPSLGSWVKTGVCAVETSWFIHSKEFSDTTISWKGHGYSVLEFEGNFAHGLHATHSSSNWECICCCALEFKGHQKNNRRWLGVFFITVVLCTSYQKQSLP